MKKVLVFKHMPAQNPGIFYSFAKEHNIEFIEIDLHAGDEIPKVSNFDGLWVMGGSMNVWEEEKYPWLIAEKQAIYQAIVDFKMPFLGICLGHQLLACAMGGEVQPTKNYEVGIFDITPTNAGINHQLLANIPNPAKWVTVHMAEITKTPKNAIILATSKVCKNHIMQIGENTYSSQFHPEVCDTTLQGWLKIPGTKARLEGLIGNDGLKDFKKNIDNILPTHNLASMQLFKNWNKLVFK